MYFLEIIDVHENKSFILNKEISKKDVLYYCTLIYEYYQDHSELQLKFNYRDINDNVGDIYIDKLVINKGILYNSREIKKQVLYTINLKTSHVALMKYIDKDETTDIKYGTGYAPNIVTGFQQVYTDTIDAIDAVDAVDADDNNYDNTDLFSRNEIEYLVAASKNYTKCTSELKKQFKKPNNGLKKIE